MRELTPDPPKRRVFAEDSMDRLREAKRIVETDREVWKKNDGNGNNWPFHFEMDKLRSNFYRGLAQLPNLVEIEHAEFASHPAVSGSYPPTTIHSASCEYIPGMKYTRYAHAMMVGVQYFAGFGAAYCAVPADPADWDKSQHGTVELKLRYWKFHICDHQIKRIDYRMCNTTYQCSECNWTFDVDSSG